jgi:hypothetical protein
MTDTDRSRLAEVTNAKDWRQPLANTGQAADLDARTAVVVAGTAADLGRAQTTDAVLHPLRVVRDPELVQIHAEAGRF